MDNPEMNNDGDGAKTAKAAAAGAARVGGQGKGRERGKKPGDGVKDVHIRNAKPRAKDYKLGCGGGLYLLVKANGSRLWRLKYKWAGVEKLLALGEYPTVSLAQAADKAAAHVATIKGGADPIEVKRRAERERVTNRLNSVAAVARDWLATKSSGSKAWRGSTLKRNRYIVESVIVPEIGDRPIADVERRELVALVKECKDRPEVAQRVSVYVGAIWMHAMNNGLIPNAVVGMNLASVLEGHEPKKQARVSPVEAPELFRAIWGYAGSDTLRHALQLSILTAARPGEIRGAMWSELDLGQRVWVIPGDRMKMKREHRVPLSRQAVTVLKAQQVLSGRGVHVFPPVAAYKDRPVDRPMSENGANFALAELGFKGRQTAHGLRAVFSTIMHELDESHEVIELCLAHGKSDVSSRYNDSQKWPERCELLQRWADYVDRVRGTDGHLLVPVQAPSVAMI
ncbi:tyrosine-type recombinase/integrase [Cupriavidus metallidurans]|uniref:tyrosine-type recombinase/integrase n=1 Tax=Cupriavidus metallidurans TaxID=119219 RepID=UPI0016462823|nr:integrase arm-type DNA-binding domain-containing protein [Cupriavidus metallidurans]